MKKLIILSLTLAFYLLTSAQELTVYFPFNKAEINTEQRKNISDFILQNNASLTLYGYADSLGTENYNKALTQIRLEGIKNILLDKNPSIQIQLVNYGETKCEFANNKQNRRIVIKVENLNYSIKKPVYKTPQRFFINNAHDTIISCKEGTKIKIPSDCFDIPEFSKATKNITLKVTEYYKLADILNAKLTTTSDGHILETGGMLFIEAFLDNKKCNLKLGKQLGIAFKNNKQIDKMQMFNGELKNDTINWKIASNIEIVAISSKKNDDLETFFIVENMPVFQGNSGEDALKTYLKDNLKYPKYAYDNKIEGKVFVQFIVDGTGKVVHVKVIRSVAPSLDYEAFRIIKNMPLWKPGLQRGQPVSVSYTIPINFSLDEINSIDTSTQVITYQQFDEMVEKDSTTVVTFSEASENFMTDYYLYTSKLDWLNCDRWANSNEGNTINVKVNNEYETIMAIVNNGLSIINAQVFDAEKMLRSFGKFIPNANLTLIGIRYENNEIYFGMKKTQANNQTIKLDYQKVDNLDFNILIEGVN